MTRDYQANSKLTARCSWTHSEHPSSALERQPQPEIPATIGTQSQPPAQAQERVQHGHALQAGYVCLSSSYLNQSLTLATISHVSLHLSPDLIEGEAICSLSLQENHLCLNIVSYLEKL